MQHEPDAEHPGGRDAGSRLPPPRDDDWPTLSADEWRAIDEIRRQLDREFSAPEPSTSPPPPPRWRRLVAAATLLCVSSVLGGIAGSVITLRWMAPTRDASPAPSASPAPTAVIDPRLTLEQALDGWLQATRTRDIAGQMRFYPPVVGVYYTWRDTPREAVRREKDRVFGAARIVVIDTGPPEITVDPDGGAAVTRFRKRYVIEGPRVNRRGEVLQELRWQRTAEGWRITSERDAAVLSKP